MIINPILPGFHPDPCICRVGNDFYLATSTFEWAPGVALFHSTDLAAWHPIGHVLTEKRLLNLEGVPDSGGIWAPALSYSEGRFWLVFTVTHQWGSTMDTQNFLTTALSIQGPWSDPAPLNCSGFDPSLFHAPDGSKWLLNMRWDHRPGRNPFAGIVRQKLDVQTLQLVGIPERIFSGSNLGRTEGPHLYFRNGWYYLITAEGGTGYEHSVVVARSRSAAGQYEISPQHPILSSSRTPEAPLQKTGHGSLVEGPDGNFYLVFLCGRPLSGSRCCNLGRETALARVRWTEDDWLEVEGGSIATLHVPAPEGALVGSNPACFQDGEHIEFSTMRPLPATLQSLRSHMSSDWCSLDVRPGWLRLQGRESLHSKFRQSHVARRLQHLHAEITTRLSCKPVSFQHLAGITAYYDTTAHFFLHLTCDENAPRCLRLLDAEMKEELGFYDLSGDEQSPDDSVWLRVRFQADFLQFGFSPDGRTWTAIGPALDSSRLSDEWNGKLGFTGTMVGMAAVDLAGGGFHADFAHLDYRPL